MSPTPPPDRCHECDAIVVLEEPAGLCYYTGGACPPGGCDCGASALITCAECTERNAMETKPIVSMPLPFPGTNEQRQINRATHVFVTDNGADYNCMFCDCKPGHVGAEWPCDVTEPPRNTYTDEDWAVWRAANPAIVDLIGECNDSAH